jgi:preprotein translocase subunit SecG
MLTVHTQAEQCIFFFIIIAVSLIIIVLFQVKEMSLNNTPN